MGLEPVVDRMDAASGKMKVSSSFRIRRRHRSFSTIQVSIPISISSEYIFKQVSPLQTPRPTPSPSPKSEFRKPPTYTSYPRPWPTRSLSLSACSSSNLDINRKQRIKALPFRPFHKLLVIDKEVLYTQISTISRWRIPFISWSLNVKNTQTRTNGHSTRAPRTSERRFLTRSRGIPGTTCPVLTFGR